MIWYLNLIPLMEQAFVQIDVPIAIALHNRFEWHITLIEWKWIALHCIQTPIVKFGNLIFPQNIFLALHFFCSKHWSISNAYKIIVWTIECSMVNFPIKCIFLKKCQLYARGLNFQSVFVLFVFFHFFQFLCCTWRFW